MKEPQMLEFAAEQFVGKSQRDLEEIILQTIEGHFRAILGLFVSLSDKLHVPLSCPLVVHSKFDSFVV